MSFGSTPVTALFGCAAFHEHDCGSAVVDAGGVAGGDAAAGIEGGLEAGQVFQGGVGPRLFVDHEHDGAVLGFEFNGHDLGLEFAGLHGAHGAAVALDGELVLILPGNAPFLRDVFRGDAHVHLIEWVGESGDEDVDRSGVIEARTPAHRGQPVGGAAHRFRAAANGGIGVAVDDSVSGGEDGLQAAAAKTIEGEG
jgi:hypothetical protein